MAIRHILVPLFGYDGDRTSLDAALVVAKRHSAHIAALHVETDPLEQTPLMVDVGVAITELVEAAERHAAHRAKNAAKTFADWQGSTGVTVDPEASVRPAVTTAFTNVKGNEEDLISRFGRLTDLVVLARPKKNEAADLIAVRIEDVLFGAGRPVLLVPHDITAEALSHIEDGPALVAWNGSIEATRAVTAGLSLIKAMGKVRVLSINGLEGFFSKELCGGTHVRATGDIGLFKITSDESIASGVRRIRAITGMDAYERFREAEVLVDGLSSGLRTTRNELPGTVSRLQEELKKARREAEELRLKIASGASGAATNGDESRDVAGIKVLAREASGLDAAAMRQLSDTLLARIKSGVVVLGRSSDGKVSLIVRTSADLTGKVPAGQVIKELAPIIGGRGGGKPDMAEGGGNQPENLQAALEKSYEVVKR